MKTYTSKTGYIQRVSTGECFKSKIIYLGVHDESNDYTDITQTEYENYLSRQQELYNNYENI